MAEPIQVVKNAWNGSSTKMTIASQANLLDNSLVFFMGSGILQYNLLMKNNASFLYSAVLILADALTIVGAFSLAYIFRVSLSDSTISYPVDSETFFTILLTLVPVILIIFGLLGLYNRNVYDKRFQELGRLFVGSIFGTLFLIAFDFFTIDPIFPAKLVPIYGFIITYLMLVIVRNVLRWLRQFLFSRNIGISNLLIVGNTDKSDELIEWLDNPRKSGYNVLGIVGGKSHDGVKRFANFETALKSIGKKPIHSIMQTELFKDPKLNNEVFEFTQQNHVAYRFVPGNSELFVGNIDVELFQASIPMIAVHQTSLLGWGRIVKRLFDFAFSIILLVILFPLLILISIISFFSDPGPVFFRQNRITRYGNTFKIFKFRTMFKKFTGTTPEEAFKKMDKPELAKKYREQGDQLIKDPRVTPFGRFLRHTSLDEIPQLFNVIKGDISLVGPRALIPQEIEGAEGKDRIISVKSGVTGLAQVSGRRNISFEERRKLDIYYVQNWTFWTDLVILFKTVRVIITGSGTN